MMVTLEERMGITGEWVSLQCAKEQLLLRTLMEHDDFSTANVIPSFTLSILLSASFDVYPLLNSLFAILTLEPHP